MLGETWAALTDSDIESSSVSGRVSAGRPQKGTESKPFTYGARPDSRVLGADLRCTGRRPYSVGSK